MYNQVYQIALGNCLLMHTRMTHSCFILGKKEEKIRSRNLLCFYLPKDMRIFYQIWVSGSMTQPIANGIPRQSVAIGWEPWAFQHWAKKKGPKRYCPLHSLISTCSLFQTSLPIFHNDIRPKGWKSFVIWYCELWVNKMSPPSRLNLYSIIENWQTQRD